MQEREIGLFDVLMEILLHWRRIVIAMLIGAVVLGGFGYFRSVRTAQSNREKIEKLEAEQMQEQEPEEKLDADSEQEWLREHLTVAQRLNIESVRVNETLYADKLWYYENSVLMQMDADHVSRYDFTYVVNADSELETTYLVQAYEDIIFSCGMFEFLAEKMQISVDSVRETLALERSLNGQFLSSNTLRLYVRYSTEQECKKLAHLVMDYIAAQKGRLAELIGEHTLTLLSESGYVSKDTDVLNLQRSNESSRLSLKTTIATAKAAFSDDEWRYYNYLTTGEATGNPYKDKEDDAKEEMTPEEAELAALRAYTTPRFSVKYVILGMILAAFLYVVIIFILYVFDQKLRATDDIQQLYGIARLGQIPAISENRKPFGFVDRWILAVRDAGKRKFSSEEAVRLAAVAVRISAQKQGLSAVYCIGCGLKGKTLEVCNTLKELLAGENVELRILNNVLYDAQALEELADAQGAVLVETAGSTFYDEITQELKLLERQEITMLGGIIVE